MGVEGTFNTGASSTYETTDPVTPFTPVYGGGVAVGVLASDVVSIAGLIVPS